MPTSPMENDSRTIPIFNALYPQSGIIQALINLARDNLNRVLEHRIYLYIFAPKETIIEFSQLFLLILNSPVIEMIFQFSYQVKIIIRSFFRDF